MLWRKLRGGGARVDPEVLAEMERKDKEIARLRAEVRHLKILVESSEKKNVSQALAREVANFASLSETPEAAEAVALLEPAEAAVEAAAREGSSTAAKSEALKKLEHATREAKRALSTAVEARLADPATVARCYGVVDACARDFAPIYASVWRLVASAEDPGVLRTAVKRLRIDQECPRVQATENEAALYMHAATVKPRFDALATTLAGVKAGDDRRTTDAASSSSSSSREGAVAVELCPRLKKMARTLEKTLLAKSGARTVAHVLDVVRAMVVADSLAGLADAVRALSESPDLRVVRVKDRFQNPAPGGWRDLLVNVVCRGDDTHHVCEIQFAHRTLLAARAGLPGHEIYARSRNATELLERLGLQDAATAKAGLAWTFAKSPKHSEARTQKGAFFPQRPASACADDLGCAARQRPSHESSQPCRRPSSADDRRLSDRPSAHPVAVHPKQP